MKTTRALVAAALCSLACFSSNAQVMRSRAEASRLFGEQKHAEAAEIYAGLAKANPYDGSLWAGLGYCLHAQKKWKEAIPAYERAIALGQNVGGNLYNMACAYALLGQKEEALVALERCFRARFAEQETIEKDTDLDSLRSDPRFAALTGLTAGLKEKPAATREEGWKWDLDFYARRMEQMHYSLYRKVSREKLLAELAALKADIGTLSDEQARARLVKITALVGDGHTMSLLSEEGKTVMRRLPVHMYAFKEGLYVIGAASDQAELIGAKVLKVGKLPADEAMKAVRPYISIDNEMDYLMTGPGFLANPIILNAIGAAPDTAGAEFTFATASGSEKTVRLAPVELPRGHNGRLLPGFSYAYEACKEPLPLYLKDRDKPLRFELDASRKLMYFWFGAVQNPPQSTLGEFVESMFESIEKNAVETLVIDMRANGGGNTGLIQPLMNAIISSKTINRPGHLYVIIGRNTFSAAQNTVNLLDATTAARFVGEPTGSCPQFVGESTYFVLPHSRTRVYCSSRYWQYMDSTDQRCWVAPQIVAEPSFAAYSTNRDPAMEAVYAELADSAK